MPKRGGHSGGRGSRGFRGGSSPQRGRGGNRGRGRGNNRSSGFKRKQHSDNNEDGFISLSGRQSEYYQPQQVARNREQWSSRKSNKNQCQPPEVKFNKAIHSGSMRKKSSKRQSDSDSDGSDQGLESDEIDESEEEILMQEFEWIEDDQDPNRKNITRQVVPSDPLPEIAIPTKWGGALSYSSSNVNFETKLKDDLLINMAYSSDNTSIPGIVDMVDHRNKRLKAYSDLPSEVQNKLEISGSTSADLPDHSNLAFDVIPPKEEPELKWVIDTEPDSDVFTSVQQDFGGSVGLTDQSETQSLSLSVSTYMNSMQGYQQSNNIAKKEKIKQSNEEDAPMWALDTMGEALDMDQIQEVYIDVPTPDVEYLSRKNRKTHRSKRGGRKLKEKERERINALTRDGAIMLEEDESELDDEELALQDYLQNTVDSDDEGGVNPFLGSMEERLLDLGHSHDVGGLDPDDSDLEYASEIDSEDDEDFDFTPKYSEGRKNRKLDTELSRAIDRAFSPNWPSGAPQGYEFFADNLAETLEGTIGSSMRARLRHTKKGEPHGGSIETLTEINRRIEEFVKDTSISYLQLEPMKTALRRRVHLISTQYGLDSESIGGGKNRATMLFKSKKTMVPKNPEKVQEILAQDDRAVKQRAVEFRRIMEQNQRFNNGNGHMSQRNQRFGNRHRGEAGSRKSQGDAIVNGAVVGAMAAPISRENVGHRLLSKMGWTPGDGLGASGSGIVQPIEAVMKRSRRGLGHA